MQVEKLVQSLLVIGAVFMVATTPVKSQEIAVQNSRAKVSVKQLLPLKSARQLLATNEKISPREYLPKSAEILVQKPSSPELVKISEVKLNTTEKGFEIILKTSQGEQLQVVPKPDGKTYIVDIATAQLNTPFRQETPVEGITEVTVANLDAKTIRVKVIPEKDAPKLELFDDDQGLILEFIPVLASAQTPQQPQTQSSQQLIQVTGVKLNNTETGFEIIVETPKAEQLKVLPKKESNTYIADISTAQLNIPFRQEKPVAGVIEVTLTNLDATTIRLKVITEANLPEVELFDGDDGLVFGVTTVVSPKKP